MRTKLDAARIATGAGHPGGAHLGRPGRRGAGRRAGRHLVPGRDADAVRPVSSGWPTPPSPRACCCSTTGAVRAVTERRASLLAAGLTGATGTFVGRATRWTSPVPTAIPVARGLVNFDAEEIPRLVGKTSAVLRRELGAAYEREVVHRDDLALLATPT